MGDGSFLRKEIPGPDNLSSWLVSWKVFRVAGLMLQILVEMALNAYRENFEKLAGLWPEAWHRLYLADDKCRSEGLPKYLRRIESSINAGNQPRRFGTLQHRGAPAYGWQPRTKSSGLSK